ncbi:MAG: OmpA family protein [Desulfuromonadaceae bacterium]|nr:OmpA family protein [Desulfuromonadaceae bacterium]
MKKTITYLLYLTMILFCAGCRTPQSMVVLIPNPDGTVGELEVSNEAGNQVLSEANQAVRVKDRNTKPSEGFAISADEIRVTFADALAAQPPPPEKFILYFKPGSSELIPESSALLSQIIQVTRKRGSSEVVISGHTDTVGARDYNYRLSLQRAQEGFAILVANGAVAEDIKVTSHGEGNLLVKTADEVAEPRNRRIEVVVK